MTIPKISVVIPARNASDIIGECLLLLLNQSKLVYKRDYEIILVDDGSEDNTVEVSNKYGIQVISQKHAGPSAARNNGVKVSRGDIIVFTDADCIASPDWLFQLTQPLISNNEIIGVKGAYRTNENGVIPRFVQQEFEYKYQRMKNQKLIDFIDTYSAAYRKNIFMENGGFDEIFPVPSVEDQELSYRLARKGYHMVFQPSAIVYHKHDLNILEYVSRKFLIGYWKVFMLGWLPEKTLTDSYSPLSQKIQIMLMLIIVVSGLLFIYRHDLGWLFGSSWLLFLCSCIPFVANIYKNDRIISVYAIPLLVIRALSQTIGLVAGFIFPPKPQGYIRKGLTMPQRIIKRIIDIIVAVIGLILSLPIIIIAFIVIKLEDDGPGLFSQQRVGENGKHFSIIKLRTMVVGAENLMSTAKMDSLSNIKYFKKPDDDRVTKIGRILRRLSIDELPQLWNVLRGEMSLVGPRPEETRVVNDYDDNQRQRLIMKPGLTGPMQISGRGNLSQQERLSLELSYINNYSLWKDIKIIVKTLPAIFSGYGAF